MENTAIIRLDFPLLFVPPCFSTNSFQIYNPCLLLITYECEIIKLMPKFEQL